MNTRELLAPAAPWAEPDETWADRIDRSASMLFIHGYITQGQRAKIAVKLTKQCEQAIAEAEAA